jgi:hypothetical protein
MVKYYTYTADVRFGKTGQLDAKTLTQFRALPSSDDPIVVFIGVRNDGETAVFLVSAAASTTGNGNCQPSNDQCTFLYMKKGDKQTIEAVGTVGSVIEYGLELRDINVKKTEAPKSSRSKGSAHTSRRGRHKTRARRHSGHKSHGSAGSRRATRSFERLGF